MRKYIVAPPTTTTSTRAPIDPPRLRSTFQRSARFPSTVWRDVILFLYLLARPGDYITRANRSSIYREITRSHERTQTITYPPWDDRCRCTFHLGVEQSCGKGDQKRSIRRLLALVTNPFSLTRLARAMCQNQVDVRGMLRTTLSCLVALIVAVEMRLERRSSTGLNHVTGRRWENVPSWWTSSVANRSRGELIAYESERFATPSRRTVRNTSCAEFETIISLGVDNLLFLRVVSRLRPPVTPDVFFMPLSCIDHLL